MLSACKKKEKKLTRVIFILRPNALEIDNVTF